MPWMNKPSIQMKLVVNQMNKLMHQAKRGESDATDVQAVDSTNEAVKTSNEGVNASSKEGTSDATEVQAVDSTNEAVKTSNEEVVKLKKIRSQIKR